MLPNGPLRQAKPGLQQALLSSCRPLSRAAKRPGHRPQRPQNLRGVSGFRSAHQLLRCRYQQEVVFLTNNFVLPALTIAQLYKLPLADGTVLQMDQAAPPHQGILRYLRERREDPNLDCHKRLLACRHHQEGAQTGPQSQRNLANSQHFAFPESSYRPSTYSICCEKPNMGIP